ncbi:MAG: ADP-ribosylglycohydrolase family protein [Methylobacteriaceae bacterium]|jgi:ADP-ribosylglycohydrolase|nr:ADP-ribosylglycohydrolase family protein [Methylobacteriaceae bacterium]
MLGAVIGDIVGSVYEWHNIKSKAFPLFNSKSHFTDDTVMTVAVADALLKGGSARDMVNSMKLFGRMFPRAGYGGRFKHWLFSENREPYNSWGNGSAMRVSPVGWWRRLKTLEEVEACAAVTAAVTHNHPEAVAGAQAVTAAIFLARRLEPKQGIRAYIEQRFNYDLSPTLDSIRPWYMFDVSCRGTVPPAVIAFLESTDFEDALRNAVSIGGDSDTLAAITGSIAEAAYGIPDAIRRQVFVRLAPPLVDVLEKWAADGAVPAEGQPG